jgi:hypothetical protein
VSSNPESRDDLIGRSLGTVQSCWNEVAEGEVEESEDGPQRGKWCLLVEAEESYVCC